MLDICLMYVSNVSLLIRIHPAHSQVTLEM